MALALGVGLLAGCGPGDPEPTGSGSLTAGSPTPTAVETTPTELVTAVPLPVMPPEMANNDAAGAEAAVRYFVELSDYVLASGDSSQWTAVTDDDCVFCQSIARQATDLVEAGLVRSGGRLNVTDVLSVEERSEQGLFLVTVQVMQDRYEYLNSAGDVIEESPAQANPVQFAVQFADGTWLLLAAGSPGEAA